MLFLSILLWPIALALLGLSFTSGRWYALWPFEILGSGYLWFAALAAILFVGLLGLAIARSRRPQRQLIVVLGVALLFYAHSILSWYVPRIRDSRAGGIPLSVMTYNVNYRLWDTEKVTDLVRAHPVDLFGLVEPFQDQAAALREAVRDLYPHYYRATGGGVSLFSRYPIAEATTENLGTDYHSLFAIVDIDGKPVRVIVTHPLAPVSKQNFIRRNQTMAALAAYCARQQLTTVLVGDFNVTSWSIYFRNFVRNSRLRSVNLGHGLNPTWFYNDLGRSLSRRERVQQILKIPIDHIFVSQDASVDEAVTVSAGVSDHRPLMTRLRML